MSNIRRRLIFLPVFLLIACTMPVTKIYTIYIPVEKETLTSKGDSSIAVHVNSERYLKQPYIAYRRSPYQLEISKYSKWESSPAKIVRKEFKGVFSSQGVFKEVRVTSFRPEGFYMLKVNLKSFERFDTGNSYSSRLLFDVALQGPDGTELYGDTVSKEVTLDDNSFENLAKGLSSALKQGIEEVSVNVVRAVNQ